LGTEAVDEVGAEAPGTDAAEAETAEVEAAGKVGAEWLKSKISP